MIVDSITQKGVMMAIYRRAVLCGQQYPKTSILKEVRFESMRVRRKEKKGEEKKRRFYLNSPVPGIKAVRLIRLYLTPVQISSQGSATCSEFTTIRRYLPRA